MSKYVFLISITMTFILSCSKQVEQKNEPYISPQEITKMIDSININGIWAINEVDNALFTIDTGYVEYLEHPDEYYKYNIENDTLIIDLNGYLSKSKILKADNDSLILLTNGDTLKLYKR